MKLKKIAVLEDDLLVAQGLQEILPRFFPDSEIEFYASYKDFSKQTSLSSLSLIITDCNLKDCNVCLRGLVDEKMKKIPTVLITGDRLITESLFSRKDLAFCYKPFTSKALLKAIENVLQKTERQNFQQKKRVA